MAPDSGAIAQAQYRTEAPGLIGPQNIPTVHSTPTMTAEQRAAAAAVEAHSSRERYKEYMLGVGRGPSGTDSPAPPMPAVPSAAIPASVFELPAAEVPARPKLPDAAVVADYTAKVMQRLSQFDLDRAVGQVWGGYQQLPSNRLQGPTWTAVRAAAVAMLSTPKYVQAWTTWLLLQVGGMQIGTMAQEIARRALEQALIVVAYEEVGPMAEDE